jgi:hypothetical protein
MPHMQALSYEIFFAMPSIFILNINDSAMPMLQKTQRTKMRLLESYFCGDHRMVFKEHCFSLVVEHHVSKDVIVFGGMGINSFASHPVHL